MDEEKLEDAMVESDSETLRIMSESGVNTLNGMHGHIDALHSKNGTLLGLSLGVISIVLVFSLEFGWLERSEMRYPLSLFSVLICVAVIASLLVFRPKDYGYLDLFDEEHIYDNLKKTPKEILKVQIITVKDALDDCKVRYGHDVTVFWIGLISFMVSLIMLSIGLL